MYKKITTKNQKIQRITVRFTTAEYVSLCNKAQSAELTLSQYIREAVCKNEIIYIDGIRELAEQVMRIGVNINQIAYNVNSTSRISKKAISNIQKDVNEIKSKIVSALSFCS